MNKIKVLIANNEPVFRIGLGRLLSDEEDIEVVGTATDGQEVVGFANELSPDVVIIDAAMPNLSGIEASKQIKAQLPNVGIIIISNYHHGAYLLPSLRAGVAGYVLRTAPIEELINAIRLVHAGGEVLDTKAVGDILHRLAMEKVEKSVSTGDLNNRELNVLKLTAKGLHNRGIATQLQISERTVQTHLANIFRKLGVGSRTEAVLYAIKEGTLAIENLP